MLLPARALDDSATSVATPLKEPAKPATTSGPAPHYPAPAAKLVRKVIDDEGKIDQVRSLHLRLKGKLFHTPEGIARSRAKLVKQFPGMDITPERFEGLRPQVSEELEIAFDERRVRKHVIEHNVRIDTRIWNGERAIIHEKYYTHPHEHYAFDARPERFVTGNLLLGLGWLCMGPHELWWKKSDATAEQLVTQYGRPEDYQITAEQDYRDRRCFVVENRPLRRRCWIDVADSRIRGLAQLFTPNPKDRLAFVNRLYGLDFESVDKAEVWVKGLSEEEHQSLAKKVIDITFDMSRPLSEFFFDDYRELAPGVWFPAHQGYALYDTDVTDADESCIVANREVDLVEAKVNELLPGSLFQMEVPDGAQVNDWSHEPPLFYKQNKDRTPEEWRQIIDEHERQNAEWRNQKEARDALVGKPAMKFPKTQWLNSEPLDWKKLQGKVVLLHFWAHWCGACHNDLPALSARYKQNQNSDIVIIGVHNPGSEMEDIKKDVKSYELGYPIVIDAPRPNEPSTWGLLSHQYGINGIPHAIVIDREGKIAGNGRLDEALGKAFELSRAKRGN